MARFDYDLFVIGAGSGGVRASRVSAALGARVAVAEERALGGTCVNVGCIPKKLLVYASHYREEFEDAEAGYGWTVGDRAFDWQALLARKDAEIRRLNGVYAELLESAGVARLDGQARVLGPHEVEVGGRRVSAANLLVATGSWPGAPNFPGREHAITSNEAFFLKELPRRILVVGGGYIAVEFAGIFRGLGAEVVQIHRGPLFLRGFDEDVRETLATEMRAKGVELRFGRTLAALERTDSGLTASLDDGSQIEVDACLLATGRRPRTRDLGLEEAGVALDGAGAVVVDELSRSSVPSIWAIGDATNRVNLTPVALHEGLCLAHTLFGRAPRRPDHELVPSAVFSQPSIACVGLSERSARERGGAVRVYRSHFRPLRHTLTGRCEHTMMKLVVDDASDRVVGVHVVAPDAAEIVQGFAVALRCGATKAQFDATIGIHPTAAEELVTLREPVAA